MNKALKVAVIAATSVAIPDLAEADRLEDQNLASKIDETCTSLRNLTEFNDCLEKIDEALIGVFTRVGHKVIEHTEAKKTPESHFFPQAWTQIDGKNCMIGTIPVDPRTGEGTNQELSLKMTMQINCIAGLYNTANTLHHNHPQLDMSDLVKAAEDLTIGVISARNLLLENGVLVEFYNSENKSTTLISQESIVESRVFFQERVSALPGYQSAPNMVKFEEHLNLE